MHDKRMTRTFLSLIVSFLMVFCIVGICICIEGKVGFVGKRNFRKSMISSNYITTIEKEIDEKISSTLRANKIDPGCVEDLFNEKSIKTAMFNYVDAVFSGKQKSMLALEFKDGLATGIRGYLEQHKVVDAEEIDTVVNEIVSNAVSYYETYVTPSFVSSFCDLSESMDRKLSLIGTVSAILFCVLSVFLFNMYRNKANALKFVIFSQTAAVIINSMIGIGIEHGGYLEDLDVGSECYVDFLHEMTVSGARQCYIISAIAAALIIILVIIRNYVREK